MSNEITVKENNTSFTDKEIIDEVDNIINNESFFFRPGKGEHCISFNDGIKSAAYSNSHIARENQALVVIA